MRYVQLRAFHHVATLGGFSRAAEALRLTQPAISDQVRKLEEAYDVLLFDRRHKQVLLTAQGQRLLEITNRMFDAEAQALGLLSESNALRAGTLRIVADSAHHLLRILGRFRTCHPGIRIVVRTGNSETVIESLLAYEAELGVLGEIPDRRDLDVLPLSATPIIAFVAATHPLAGREVMPLRDLVREPLVLREDGSKTRAKLEAAASEIGLRLTPAIEAEGREAVREIVASGAGVGFVSAAEFESGGRLAPIRIDGPRMVMDEALVCLRERSGGKLVRAFWTEAETMVSGA